MLVILNFNKKRARIQEKNKYKALDIELFFQSGSYLF